MVHVHGDAHTQKRQVLVLKPVKLQMRTAQRRVPPELNPLWGFFLALYFSVHFNKICLHGIRPFNLMISQKMYLLLSDKGLRLSKM